MRASAARVCSPPLRADGALSHSPRAKPNPEECLVDPHVEVVAVTGLEPLAELGVGGCADGVGARPPPSRPTRAPYVDIDGARSDGEADRVGAHERRIEVRLLREQTDGQAATWHDLARIGLVAPGGQAEERRLAGTVGLRPSRLRSPCAMAPLTSSRMTKVPISRRTAAKSQDGQRSGAGAQQACCGRVAFRTMAAVDTRSRSGYRGHRARCAGWGRPQRWQGCLVR
jgi:hypothetical protein